MFRRYGVLGLVLIVLVEINFFLKIQPFADWYFPIIWFGYIMLIDALVYKLRKESILSNHFNQFLGMLALSAFFWWTFEFINGFVGNWSYHGGEALGGYRFLFKTLAFATVLPALFETAELFRAIHLFDKKKLHKTYKLNKNALHGSIGLGVLCFVLPFLFPTFAFPLIWLGFFFILDPINYLHKQPSIIGHLRDRNLAVPLSLLLSGITLGFLWEFWNYWAVHKWTYTIPFVGFFKIFEMPILGYLGYFPFALELYAMYWFARSLFIHKEHLLV